MSNHKTIGEKYKLFFFNNEQIPGQAMFLTKGNIMFSMLESIIRKIMLQDGYKEVKSGSFGIEKMWKNTKHTLKYSENIFYINGEYVLKPMNCPMHMIIAQKIYNQNSYLPIRLFEFNYCYRNEKSGSLCGMLRLNRFTQDDSHSIERFSQVNITVEKFINNIKKLYTSLEIKSDHILFRLSIIEQQNYIGTEAQRLKTQSVLKNCLEKNNIKYEEQYDGAFYAPKIDVIINDSQNRQWQTGTIQLDMCILQNSCFKTQNNDNINQMCVVHQALLGTFERFIAVLLEYNGKIPKLVNPYQIAVIFINNSANNIELYEKIVQNIQNFDKRTIDYIYGKHVNEKTCYSRDMNYEYNIVIGEKEIKDGCYQIQNNKSKIRKTYFFNSIVSIDF